MSGIGIGIEPTDAGDGMRMVALGARIKHPASIESDTALRSNSRPSTACDSCKVFQRT
jgi:hypothetical protein